MKTAELQIEDYLYKFYQMIGESAGRTAEQVMEDALLKWAGEISLEVQAKKRKK